MYIFTYIYIYITYICIYTYIHTNVCACIFVDSHIYKHPSPSSLPLLVSISSLYPPSLHLSSSLLLSHLFLLPHPTFLPHLPELPFSFFYSSSSPFLEYIMLGGAKQIGNLYPISRWLPQSSRPIVLLKTTNLLCYTQSGNVNSQQMIIFVLVHLLCVLFTSNKL
jgi:hypothetical protein